MWFLFVTCKKYLVYERYSLSLYCLPKVFVKNYRYISMLLQCTKGAEFGCGQLFKCESNVCLISVILPAILESCVILKYIYF